MNKPILAAYLLCSTILISCGASGTGGSSANTAEPAPPPATQPSSLPAAQLATQEPTMAEQPTTPPEPTKALEPTTPPEATKPPLQPQPTIAPISQAPQPAATVPPGDPAQPVVEPALAGYVAQASADLAKRQSVAESAISVVEARSVTWPDGGMGCPKPGMVYPQVLVDGLFIRLSVGGQVFNYHAGNGRAPFLCEQGSEPPAPAPGMAQ